MNPDIYFWAIQAMWALILGLGGIVINHLLKENRDLRNGMADLLKEVYQSYTPKADFDEFARLSREDRHHMKENIKAIEIRLGAWNPDAGQRQERKS